MTTLTATGRVANTATRLWTEVRRTDEAIRTAEISMAGKKKVREALNYLSKVVWGLYDDAFVVQQQNHVALLDEEAHVAYEETHKLVETIIATNNASGGKLEAAVAQATAAKRTAITLLRQVAELTAASDSDDAEDAPLVTEAPASPDAEPQEVSTSPATASADVPPAKSPKAPTSDDAGENAVQPNPSPTTNALGVPIPEPPTAPQAAPTEATRPPQVTTTQPATVVIDVPPGTTVNFTAQVDLNVDATTTDAGGLRLQITRSPA